MLRIITIFLRLYWCIGNEHPSEKFGNLFRNFYSKTANDKFYQVFKFSAFKRNNKKFRWPSYIDIVLVQNLENDVKNLLSEDAGKFVHKLLQTRAEMFAEDLHTSMKGFGTDETTLISILVAMSKSPYEQQEVKKIYKTSK